MKKMLKSVLGVAAAAGVIGTTALPVANVAAWGDNGGGRASYTLDQINSGVLGDKIVFNSISNSTIGDEKNFVGARVDDGNHGKDNVWNGNDITIEEGKTYIIRLYVHNNSPKGEAATAENVTTTFSVPSTIGTTVQVNGYISASNATPSKYWDYVNFHSDKAFYLDYIEGSALLENNGYAKNGGKTLSDNIIKESGVKIGYAAEGDGKIPGCYQYAEYVTIKVKPVFVSNNNFLVEKKVRFVGEKEWKENVDAKVGDKVEYQIHYKNLSGASVENVMVADNLPTNMKLVEGTTVLYNTTNPKGLSRGDIITTSGLNIGGYDDQGDAYIRFQAEVIDKNLACGQNQLINWGKVTVNGKVSMDSANVFVKKSGGDCDGKKENTEPQKDETTTTPSTTPTNMPSTGPASIVASIVGAGSVATALGYYIVSRKQLR